jgi:hypothetical protein
VCPKTEFLVADPAGVFGEKQITDLELVVARIIANALVKVQHGFTSWFLTSHLSRTTRLSGSRVCANLRNLLYELISHESTQSPLRRSSTPASALGNCFGSAGSMNDRSGLVFAPQKFQSLRRSDDGRDDIVSGPGGSQIWILDPSGNIVELFESKR